MNKHFYELQFEIENACLLDCVHCSSVDMRHNAGIAYTSDELIRFVSAFSGETHIYFTGGEPLLFPDLLPVCQKIKETVANTSIGLYTTGNCKSSNPISCELAEQMRQAGIEDCYFSVYSNDEKEHDYWTGTAGSFINTICSVQSLKKHGIAPKAHLVLNRYNQHKIKEVIQFCQQIGMEEVRILKLTPSGSAKENWAQIGIPLEEQNKIIQDLIINRNAYVVKLSFSGYPDLHPCRSWEHAKGCQAGTHLLYIGENGDVYPCACTKRNPGAFKICSITNIECVRRYVLDRENLECNYSCLNEAVDLNE